MNIFDNLPKTLRSKGRFCVWRYEDREGKQTKCPYNPRTGGGAQSGNPATFSPYSAAMAALTASESMERPYSGLGIGVFQPFGAIDIDHCIDENGELTAVASDIMDIMDVYTEKSPSGTGLRLLFTVPEGFVYDKGKFYIKNPSNGVEVYIAGCTNRFVTVTGNALTPGKELEEREDRLLTVLNKYMVRPAATFTGANTVSPPVDLDDAALIDKAMHSKNGQAFSALWIGDTKEYASRSEADLALCNALAFWTNRDMGRMDRLFRCSGLFREKWDRAQSGTTYGKITLEKAVKNCEEGYDPQAHFKSKANKYAVTVEDRPLKLADLHPEKNERYGWHDIGNGYLFADWFKDRARYVPERKKWFIYNGRVWAPDPGNLQAMELCKKLADALAIYALSIEDERQRNDYLTFARRWQRRNYRETVLKDAAGVYPAEMAEFDADPYLFNCLNGTLDLRTRVFRGHSAADMLSKISGVSYDPESKCERWERFISEVMQGDAGKAAFLQKSLGLTLTGDTAYECFFILYGATARNGKGTTMETFMRLMGDYGRTTKPDTISQKQNTNSNSPSEDIARLDGARFVNIPEPDKRLVLSAALVKTLTGNDTILARFLNENSFEFRPQFKIFINTNHLPAVTDVTLFSSGRVKVIPFERHFEEAEQDKNLKSVLARPENLSGILNWCLDGLWMLQETGLDPPDAVLSATDQYRQDNDKISRFIADEMEAGPGYEVQTAAAFARWTIWCSSNGFMAGSSKGFNADMGRIATIERRRPWNGGEKTTMISGYRLRPQITNLFGDQAK